jgi:hypothetical protein
MPQPLDVTVITPTTGKPSLDRPIAGIENLKIHGLLYYSSQDD